MVYTGRMRNGVVVLDNGADLPEGTPVRVETITPTEQLTLAERWADVIGTAEGLPADLAENHDHYLHGTPKKKKRK